MNVEGMYSVNLKKRLSEAKPSFEILRLDILRFCGSRLGLAKSHTKIQDLGLKPEPFSAYPFLNLDNSPPDLELPFPFPSGFFLADMIIF